MPENVTKPEPTPVTEPTTGPTAPAPTQDEKRFTQADIDRIIADRLTSEKRKQEEAITKAQAKAEAEAAAKNGEWEKLAKAREVELAERDKKLAEIELSQRRRAVADKVGLPGVFVDRIRGVTPEEMEADAKTILEALPKQQHVPNISTTNPGGDAGGQTDAQKLARIHNAGVNIFDPAVGKTLGGGVYFNQKEAQP